MPEKTLAPVRLGNTRVTGKEQYYTPVALANQLVAEVEKVLGPLQAKTVLEPAGGTGAFIQAALAAGANRVISYDIEPLHSMVQQGSFLDQELNEENLITISGLC